MKLSEDSIIRMAKHIDKMLKKKVGKNWKNDPNINTEDVVQRLQKDLGKMGMKFDPDDIRDLVEVAKAM